MPVAEVWEMAMPLYLFKYSYSAAAPVLACCSDCGMGSVGSPRWANIMLRWPLG